MPRTSTSRGNVPNTPLRPRLTRRLYELVVDTYEPGNPFPIVSHIFRGKSPREAEAYLTAHLKADAFLRECSKSGIYRTPSGQPVACRTRTYGRWVSV